MARPLEGTTLSAIHAIFWDVGGVLLTNAWDHTQRADALQHFQLDEKEFHDRHEMVVSSFERGKITLDEYLDRTVFYRPRPFTREDFREYMFELSKPFPRSAGVRARPWPTPASTSWGPSTMNRESLTITGSSSSDCENSFDLFVSSCFVGYRKPERDIYRLALEITQIPAEQCCFIDDRALNLECAAKLGMKTIEMRQVDQLREDLAKLGVTL